MHQLPLDGGDGPQDSLVVGRKEAGQRDLEQRPVELLRTERLGERAELGVEPFRAHQRLDLVSPRPPTVDGSRAA